MDSNPLLDPEWQRLSAIKSLFDSPGWKIFEQELNDRLACATNEVKNLSGSFLKREQVEEYNFRLAKQKCFEEILFIKDELLPSDENSPAQESDGEQNSSEMS